MIFQQMCRRKAGIQYFRHPQRSHDAGFDSPGFSWQYFRESQRQLEIIWAATAYVRKFGRSLGLCQWKCLRPDRDQEIPDICCKYLVRGHIGWYWFRRRIGKLRRRDEIIGLGPTAVGDIWLGSISVWYIWVRIDVSWGYRYSQLESQEVHAL